MSRKRTAAAATWRDGVHLTGTPIWCDARRRRDVCFVSAADRVGRAGHGQLIATDQTLALVAARGAGNLGVPLRRKFTLGTLRLELLSSGRGLGAAALLVDRGGTMLLYAGAIRADGPEPAEVRSCDAVVVGAPFGEPHHVFPRIAEVAAEVAAWATSVRDEGGRAVVTADTSLDALEIATELSQRSLPCAGTRTVRDAADRGHVPLLAPSRHAHLLVRVEGDRPSTAELGPRPIHALASGRALDVVGTPAGAAYAALFPWASAAGQAELLTWIEQTSAREVYVTGACADAIVAAVGPRARALGPPQQMQLFEAS